MNLILLINLILFNPGYSTYTVMASSGVNLREEPYLHSKKVMLLPFGEKVETSYSPPFYPYNEDLSEYRKDTIDNLIGYWVDVKVPYYNVKGYVFSPFLFRGERINPNIKKNEIRLEIEGHNCMKSNFHPDLYWYGIYHSNDSTYILKTDVQLELINNSLSPMHHPEHDEHRLVSKNDLKSEILIGFSENQNSNKFKSLLYTSKYRYGKDNFGYLSIDSTLSISSNGISHKFSALKAENKDTDKPYVIKFSARANDRTLIEHTFSFCCNIESNNEFGNPKITWLGDLNDDNILDIIFTENSTAKNCDAWSKYYLYLSSFSNNQFSMQLVSTLNKHPCD